VEVHSLLEGKGSRVEERALRACTMQELTVLYSSFIPWCGITVCIFGGESPTPSLHAARQEEDEQKDNAYIILSVCWECCDARARVCVHVCVLCVGCVCVMCVWYVWCVCYMMFDMWCVCVWCVCVHVCVLCVGCVCVMCVWYVWCVCYMMFDMWCVCVWCVCVYMCVYCVLGVCVWCVCGMCNVCAICLICGVYVCVCVCLSVVCLSVSLSLSLCVCRSGGSFWESAYIFHVFKAASLFCSFLLSLVGQEGSSFSPSSWDFRYSLPHLVLFPWTFGDWTQVIFGCSRTFTIYLDQQFYF